MKTRTIITRAVLVLFLTITALGAGSPAHAQAPPEAGGRWRSVSAGGFHNCGIRTTNGRDGHLWCWGWNDDGQLGTGDLYQGMTPREIGYGTDWRSVAAGPFHTCGINGPGVLHCWGDDREGQLGNAEQGARRTPTEIAAGVRNWTKVTAGAFHTCGLRSTGALFCWGSDTVGQVGDGPGGPPSRLVPVRVRGSYRSVDAGLYHTCAVRTNGRLACWGDDSFGQLGNGAQRGTTPVPVDVAGPGRSWTQVAAGDQHTCGLAANRRIFCWGDDENGQLGNGPTSSATKQTPIGVASSDRFSGVTAGMAHSCGYVAQVGLSCWGADHNGQVGNNADLVQASEPDGVVISGRVARVSAGGVHTCAVNVAGALFCWGDNSRAQLAQDPDLVRGLPEPARVVPRPS
jgi:alpha-tubulin suppressor-like RCC1 family protein